MIDFFVTGLPRSRTAWLANFLTVGESYCAHDALVGCESLGAFERKMAAMPGSIHGDSDSALVFFAPPLMEKYPAARWLVVRRDPIQVVRSLARMEPYHGLHPLTHSEAQTVVDLSEKHLESVHGQQVRVIEFEALESMEALREIWSWCLADRIPFCEARAAMLHTMRVTAIPPKIDPCVEAMRSLLGEAA